MATNDEAKQATEPATEQATEECTKQTDGSTDELKKDKDEKDTAVCQDKESATEKKDEEKKKDGESCSS